MVDSDAMMTLDVYNQVNYVIILIIAKIAQMKLAVVSIKFDKKRSSMINANISQMKLAVVSIKFNKQVRYVIILIMARTLR